MLKIFAGVLVALVIAVGGYFGFEFYLQRRIVNDIEAAFANVRASGAKATHGKIVRLAGMTAAVATPASPPGYAALAAASA